MFVAFKGVFKRNQICQFPYLMPLHRDKFVTSQRASNHLLLKQFTVVWKKLFSVILPIIFYSIQESPQPDVSTIPLC